MTNPGHLFLVIGDTLVHIKSWDDPARPEVEVIAKGFDSKTTYGTIHNIARRFLRNAGKKSTFHVIHVEKNEEEFGIDPNAH